LSISPKRPEILIGESDQRAIMNQRTKGMNHGSSRTLNRGSSNEAGNTDITISSKHWAIVEGWIPASGDETVSLLNVSGQKAHVEITVYYSQRDAAGPYCITVPEGGTEHVHLNRLTDAEPIPRETIYESTIESDVPIVVQHPKAWETRHYRKQRPGEDHFLSHHGPE
jgi:hypothetical protein